MSWEDFFFSFNYTYRLVPIITCALWDKSEGPEDGSMPLLPVFLIWKMDRDYALTEGSILPRSDVAHYYTQQTGVT